MILYLGKTAEDSRCVSVT